MQTRVRSDIEVPRQFHPATKLAWNVVAALLHVFLFANAFWIIPLLVRLKFGSVDPHVRDWQTTLVTAALPAAMLVSVFWGELLNRVSVRRYLMLFWLVAVVPLGCIGFVQNYWQLLICHLVACVGTAGWAPLDAKLLKHLYADSNRGRFFAVIRIASNAAAMMAIYFVGKWIEAYPSAFRVYFPTAAIVELGTLVVLFGLVRWTGMPERRRAGSRPSWVTIVRPMWQARKVLVADRVFLRYELAFMTYGAAFMFCEALLPVLATEQLHMQYEEYAHSTQFFVKAAMIVGALPMGWVLDRIGAVRTSGIAFAALGLYPILLWLAEDANDVAIASTVMGLGMAGVSMGWMLGPVSLAPTVRKVPQYLAIHATLVGVRGVVFQGAGMALYKLTGAFSFPLLMAAVLFWGGAAQMWMLQVAVRRRTRAGG